MRLARLPHFRWEWINRWSSNDVEQRSDAPLTLLTEQRRLYGVEEWTIVQRDKNRMCLL